MIRNKETNNYSIDKLAFLRWFMPASAVVIVTIQMWHMKLTIDNTYAIGEINKVIAVSNLRVSNLENFQKDQKDIDRDQNKQLISLFNLTYLKPKEIEVENR